MRTIELTGVIAGDRTLTVQLPADVPAGHCRVTVAVADGPRPGEEFLAGWPTFPDCVLTDPTDTFRRETLYGDHGL